MRSHLCQHGPGGVNFTPGLTPVSVPAGSSSFSFNFNQPIPLNFANNKFSFTSTLYWSLGTVYTPSSTKSGASLQSLPFWYIAARLTFGNSKGAA